MPSATDRRPQLKDPPSPGRGHVVVDDVEPDSASFRPSSPIVAMLMLGVVAVLVLLPGQPEEVPATPTTIPELVLPEDEWARLELPGSGGLSDVTMIENGDLVAVGAGPQFWHSSSVGSVWEPRSAASGVSDQVTAVEGFGPGAVAVGADTGRGLSSSAAAWWSADGRVWDEVEIGFGLETPSGLTGLATGDGGVLAWGWTGSSRPFDPAAEILLLYSEEGRRWRAVEPPATAARVLNAVFVGGFWYVMGAHDGSPALWVTADLSTWETVTARSLPFGWAMTSLEFGDQWRATLVDVDSGGTRQWELDAPRGWTAVTEPLPGGPVTFSSPQLGVGSGGLWSNEGSTWAEVDLAGDVAAVGHGIAVGEDGGQPVIWARDSDSRPEVAVPPPIGAHWEQIASLGQGRLYGAWSVAGNWVVKTDSGWWVVTDGDARPMEGPPPADPTPNTIQQVGDEWVTVPSLFWSGDGERWATRAPPWEGGYVRAVSVIDGKLRAIGTNAQFMWSVAESDDRGRTWSMVGEPSPVVPVWDATGVTGGFVANLARPQGGRDVVSSSGGYTWEPVAAGTLLPGLNVPAAVTEQGDLAVFDSGEVLTPPRVDVEALVRDGPDLIMVADGRMFSGGAGGWTETPLTPQYGMSAAVVYPLPTDTFLVAVVVDRGEIELLRWRG